MSSKVANAFSGSAGASSARVAFDCSSMSERAISRRNSTPPRSTISARYAGQLLSMRVRSRCDMLASTANAASTAADATAQPRAPRRCSNASTSDATVAAIVKAR